MEDQYQRYNKAKQQLFWLKSDVDLPDDVIQTILTNKSTQAENRLQYIAPLVVQKLNVPVLQTRILQGGTFSILFEAESSAQRNYVVKTSLTSDIPSTYLDFFCEAMLAQLLQQHQLSCVPIYAAGCNESASCFDYIVMAKASGKPLVHLISPTLSVRWEEFGQALANVHQITLTGFGPLIGDPLKTAVSGQRAAWEDYIYTALTAHLQYCYDHRVITQKLLAGIERCFALTGSILQYQEQPALLHGDLGDSNIYRDENGKIILLDWGDALAGDPLYDIAMWGTFIGHHEHLQSVLVGYEMVEKLPVDFMLRYWLYYLRIILAKTVHRCRFQYDRTDKIPAISRIMQPLEELNKLI